MIALIDYGAGNLTSVKKAFGAIGAGVFVPDAPADLDRASAIVVPGVGHFGATRALAGAWTDALLAWIERGRPLLGICLGMQWLFEGSEEAPDVPGLGILHGRIVRLRPDEGVKVPHVGWNALAIGRRASILSGVGPESQVYFTHSYVAPVTSETIAATDHGVRFASVVERGRVAGVQFHPEKSGEVGLRVLRNFWDRARTDS